MAKTVHVKVKIFAAPALALETSELSIDLAENATAQDLLNSIPIKETTYLYVVREGIRLNRSSRLKDGDEILIVPPIAGG